MFKIQNFVALLKKYYKPAKSFPFIQNCLLFFKIVRDFGKENSISKNDPNSKNIPVLVKFTKLKIIFMYKRYTFSKNLMNFQHMFPF